MSALQKYDINPQDVPGFLCLRVAAQCRIATIPYELQMIAIEKTGEISIAVVRDSIGLVSKVPRAAIKNFELSNMPSEPEPRAYRFNQ